MTTAGVATKSQRFHGKVAVVTGASSGIGFATAEQLAREGARLVVVARGPERLESAAELLRTAGAPAVLAVAADVGTEAGCKACVDAAMDEFGCLHAFFANAGMYRPVKLADTTDDILSEYLNSNIKSVVHGVKYAMAAMQESGVKGSIVVNSSAMSHVTKSGFEGVGVYAATKAAADMIVRHAAIEGAAAGIRVNAVRPGIVSTGILGPQMTEELWDKFAASKSLANRAGRAAEVATFVAYLLSEESEFINASMHDLDGGWSVVAE